MVIMEKTNGKNYSIGVTRKVNLGNYEMVDVFFGQTIPVNDDMDFEQMIKEWENNFDKAINVIENKISKYNKQDNKKVLLGKTHDNKKEKSNYEVISKKENNNNEGDKNEDDDFIW